MPAKVIVSSPEGTREVMLGPFNTVGRHPDNAVQVLDRIVSKEHCRITLGPRGRYVIRDLGSLNGTYVNDQRIEEHELCDADRIQLGNTTLDFVADPLSADANKAPAAKHVTMMAGPVQSQVRSSLEASGRFLPAASVSSIDILRADYEKLRVAHELSQKLSLALGLDDLLQRIVDETLALIAADRAVILLMEDGQLVPRHVRQRRAGEEINLSQSILDEVRTTKRAVLSSDATIDHRFRQAKSVIMQGIRSAMCVPLLVPDETEGSQLVGIMHMDSMLTSGVFTEKDLQLFTGIATQAAIAIQNRRLASKIETEAATRAQFQRLLSPNLVEEIVRGSLKLENSGVNVEVTMLFADIRGFTSMSERHTPEDMVRTLNEYFELMVDVLFRHGGTLDKYVGDEIIGLFGAPVPVADGPGRALRCAREMRRALGEWNRLRVDRGLEPLQVGVGINTGPVIAGAIGSSQTLQYTVIGDAVNIAARLCSAAGPMEILASESTVHRARVSTGVEEATPLRVKGKSEALRVYRVVSEDLGDGTAIAPAPSSPRA